MHYTYRSNPKSGLNNLCYPNFPPTLQLTALAMNLKMIQWNIRGYYPQRPYLLSAIDSLNPHVIILQETHSKPHHHLSLPQYHFPPARYDRRIRKGGGAAIFTHQSVPITDVPLDTSLEACAIRVHTQHRPITICSLYLAPDTPSNTLDQKLTELCQQLATSTLYSGN